MPFRLCLLLGLLSAGALGAATSLENARRAQALLGPVTWSRVLRVENTAAHSLYPATVDALVFEEAGLLWFYTDTDGTQSLSQSVGRLAEEKSDLAPLLRAIDPGFTVYSLPPDPAGAAGPAAGGALLNGCFVECLAALRDRVRRGEPVERARLLACYFDTPGGRGGHTVLTYETPRGLFLLDPTRSAKPQRVPRAWTEDARALAVAALPGIDIARARWVPTAVPARDPLVAAVDFAGDRAPGATPKILR